MSTIVAIGNGDTPTPIGEFYLIELLRPSNPDGAYGPFAYGLSGYSETLESFNGGDGVIGIHGTNRADQLGQDVSHGCIRVANPTITEMTQFLPLGTPVIIFRNA
jgi:lipoprotein-anchoring transpeptidase ErfK/SrfK